MNGSFDRFTERARKVLTLAQHEAERLNHNYIGTEHLLLGLVAEGEGGAAKVLSNLGVELGKARSGVESIIGRGERRVRGELGLTPQAKKVIELSFDEARRLGHHYIGTEHLLLGLIRQGEGVAAGVLESLGVHIERAHADVIKILTQTGWVPHSGERRSQHAGDRWEYLTLETTWSGGGARVRAVNGHEDPRFTMHHTAIHEALKELGEERWELVGIDATAAESAGTLYVFKRPS